MKLYCARFGSLALSAVLVSAAFAAYAADLSGMWWIKDRSGTIPMDHAKIPLLPKAMAQYKQNQADVAAGKTVPIGNNPCLVEGMPRMMLEPYPFQILQKPEQITFLHERNHQYRFVYMKDKFPQDLEELDPNYRGHSFGHWEGDTLVVRVVGLKPNSVLDKTGIPHSDQMQLTERFSLEDGGATLKDAITVTDPATFSKPWSFTVVYAKSPGVHLMDDACMLGPPQRDTMKQ